MGGPPAREPALSLIHPDVNGEGVQRSRQKPEIQSGRYGSPWVKSASKMLLSASIAE
jgi:hypothetical protein